MKLESLFALLIAGAISLPGLAQSAPTQKLDDFIPDISGNSPEQALKMSSPVQLQDAIRSYEQQMDVVTVQTYTEMAQIAQSARTHQISSTQAEYFVRRGYELALIRFMFLDTLHEIAQNNLADPASPGKGEEQKPAVETSGDTLMVLPPVASLTISDAVVRYLELTPGQVAVIQARIAQQQKEVQPLLRKLSENRQALATASRASSDHQIKKLAEEQSHIVERLIIANSRLQRNIYEVLAPPQRSKLEIIGQTATGLGTNLFAQR